MRLPGRRGQLLMPISRTIGISCRQPACCQVRCGDLAQRVYHVAPRRLLRYRRASSHRPLLTGRCRRRCGHASDPGRQLE